MKLPTMRGPNWPDAKTTAAMRTENATPATPITPPATVVRTARALSGSMSGPKPIVSTARKSVARSKAAAPKARTAAAAVMANGTNQ